MFTLKYANQGAMHLNPIVTILYYVTSPVSIILARIGLSPNFISFLSLLFAILSFFFYYDNPLSIYFSLFWFVSVILDFCDGQVARINNKISHSGFNLDHYLDLLKFILLCTVLYSYNSGYFYSILYLVVLFLFLVFEILTLDFRNKIHMVNNVSSNMPDNASCKPKWLMCLYVSIFTVNAHTMVLLTLIPFSFFVAHSLFIFLGFVFAYNIFRLVVRLSNIKLQC